MVVPRCSGANLVGKYLRYQGLLKRFSTPLTTLDLSNKPEEFQRRVCSESRVQYYAGKNMAAVHCTTIPCEPYAAHKAQGKVYFCNIWPCAKLRVLGSKILELSFAFL